MAKILFSHGFGVDKTDGGLFSDIAAAFPKLETVLFDYYEKDTAGNTRVESLSSQVRLLESNLAACGEDDWLVCHSLGCVVASLTKLPKLRGVILLTPPLNESFIRYLEQAKQRKGARIEQDGSAVLPRSNGTMTIVERAFLEDIASLASVETRYAMLAEAQDVTIILAAQDEVLGEMDYAGVSRAKVYTLPGDHSFTGTDRAVLIDLLESIIS